MTEAEIIALATSWGVSVLDIKFELALAEYTGSRTHEEILEDLKRGIRLAEQLVNKPWPAG